MDQPVIDPVCLIHGKRWSEHEYGRCLYCCLCFKPLTINECHVDTDGIRRDVCNECAEQERKWGYWMILLCLHQILDRRSSGTSQYGTCMSADQAASASCTTEPEHSH